MRKNYFMKNLVAALMLFAVSLGMSSCSGFIDAVIGTSDQPTTQPTTQPKATVVTVTAEGAKVEASNASEVSKALGNLVDDIKAKGVGEGKEYKVEVSGVSSESTASENTIVVPKVENSNINLVFTEAVATSSAPLVVKASETTSTESKAAVNELTITVPNAESLDLKVDMPETTVTLKSSSSNSVIKSIVAKTALNTLIIESGVTVEELEVQGGRVIVKSGGKIETYVYPASEGFIRISSDGVIPYRIAGIDQSGNEDWDNPVWQIADEQNNPYYIQNLKIIKGQAEYATIEHEIEVNKLFKKLIIADGAAVNYKNGEDIRIETIEGQGNAKFLYGVSFEQDGKMVYTGNCDLRYVKNINKVAFMPLWKDKVEWTSIQSIPNNAQNSLFEAMSIYSLPNTYDLTSYTVTNNTYNFTEYFNILIPGQSSSRSSFAFKFDRCKFSNNAKLDVVLNESEPVYNADGTPKMIYPYIDATGNYHVAYAKTDIPSDCLSWWETQDSQPITFSGYKGTVEFNKCKYGADDIKKDTPFLTKGLFWESNIDLKFIIDGTTYTPTYGSSTSGSTSVDITLN